MTIAAVASTAYHAPAGESVTAQQAPTAAASQTLLDRDAFLKLLVAQLRYQDPSKPIDSTELISQSAQLSIVEKLSELSTLLERSAVADQLSLAGSIVGKQIAFLGPNGEPLTATVSYVSFEQGAVILGAGGWDVPFTAVTAVFDPIAGPGETTGAVGDTAAPDDADGSGGTEETDAPDQTDSNEHEETTP